MRLLLSVLATGVLATVFVSTISSQPQQRPATTDDLLTELRAMRRDMKELTTVGVRAQLASSKLTLQEARLNTLAQQLSSVRQQMAQSQLTLAPFAAQLKQAKDTPSEILAPLRTMIDQVQRREAELRTQEAELTRAITSEENRMMEFRTELDQIERTLTNPQR
jgi:chromosome segregation ATPase